jgi:methionine aminopeptidase
VQARLGFGDGAGGAVIDASEAFNASISVDHGDAVSDFDSFCRATGFAGTTTNTCISINNGSCHFPSPEKKRVFKKRV